MKASESEPTRGRIVLCLDLMQFMPTTYKFKKLASLQKRLAWWIKQLVTEGDILCWSTCDRTIVVIKDQQWNAIPKNY